MPSAGGIRCECEGLRPDMCLACGNDHPPIDHVAELFLPWQAVGCEVIDADADLVATFANPHDPWQVVDTMNGMRT